MSSRLRKYKVKFTLSCHVFKNCKFTINDGRGERGASASEHLMKRPKADWVASLIAVTLLIFAAGVALDRSRLVRAASISSNLGRTTTATSLGTNLGRRHLELDVLVGVVTGTHGDGRRPQPGATPPTGTGTEVLV